MLALIYHFIAFYLIIGLLIFMVILPKVKPRTPGQVITLAIMIFLGWVGLLAAFVDDLP